MFTSGPGTNGSDRGRYDTAPRMSQSSHGHTAKARASIDIHCQDLLRLLSNKELRYFVYIALTTISHGRPKEHSNRGPSAHSTTGAYAENDPGSRPSRATMGAIRLFIVIMERDNLGDPSGASN
jgi:hypothetical protein